VKEVVEMLKSNMAGDMTVLKLVAEQLFGKAAQQLELAVLKVGH
jgi:hypothetical protein